MKTRSLPIILALASLTLTAGCMGPTKAGKEARADAHDRIDAFTAKFAIDQAEQDFKTGQLDKALEQVNRAIVVEPGESKHFVMRGRVYLEMHKLEQSVDSLETAATLDPENPDPHYYLGIIYQRWSNDEKALEHYETASELDDQSVQYLLAVGETLISLDRLDDARERIEARMTYFEHNAALRHLLGQIATLEGNHAKAARLYEEAAILSPDDQQLIEELAWVQYEGQMYGPCLETVRRLQARSTKPRTDLMHLEARCLTLLDHSAEAHRQYVDLTKIEPSNVAAWIEFGTLAWKLGDYRRMAECSLRTIELAPDRFEGYMLKGLFERHRDRTDLAVPLFEQAAARADGSVLPYLLLGQTLEQMGENEKALAVYHSATKADPSSHEAKVSFETLQRRLEIASAE